MEQRDKTAVRVLVHGQVQGVGFRYFAQELAVELGLVGWVRNLSDGDVEAYTEGQRQVLETWIARLRQGPPLARVNDLRITWQIPQGTFRTFTIQ